MQDAAQEQGPAGPDVAVGEHDRLGRLTSRSSLASPLLMVVAAGPCLKNPPNHPNVSVPGPGDTPGTSSHARGGRVGPFGTVRAPPRRPIPATCGNRPPGGTGDSATRGQDAHTEVRAGVDTDKLTLLERFGSQMLATARRYSANAHDAEDAYQRAAEILLTHEPTGSDDDLCRWLRTTVKHEALAIRRRQERVLPSGPPERVKVTGVNPADTEERAERFERLRQGAQALGRLKPQEVRCLRLRAEGYSYREICELTGWSYTKVNRCLTEGRRAFLERLAGIESGAECERLAPAAVRRRRRRGRRRRPGRAAAPPAPLPGVPRPAARVPRGPRPGRRPGARGGAGHAGRVRRPSCGRCSSRPSAPSRTAPPRSASARHQGAELAAGQKVAAVATSAAIASGGGVAAERLATRSAADAARPRARGQGAASPSRARRCARRAAVTPVPQPRPEPVKRGARQGGPGAGPDPPRRQPPAPRPVRVLPGGRDGHGGAPRNRPPRPRHGAGAASSRPSGCPPGPRACPAAPAGGPAATRTPPPAAARRGPRRRPPGRPSPATPGRT